MDDYYQKKRKPNASDRKKNLIGTVAVVAGTLVAPDGGSLAENVGAAAAAARKNKNAAAAVAAALADAHVAAVDVVAVV